MPDVMARIHRDFTRWRTWAEACLYATAVAVLLTVFMGAMG